MDLHFKELTINAKEELAPFFSLRELTSCEYNFNTLFLWAEYNKIQYAVTDNYVVFSEIYNKQFITLMPLCKEKHFKEAFEDILNHFKVNKLPFYMYVTDKVFAEFVEKNYRDQYEITTDRDLFDYIYDAEKLRTLSGKKYNKKRNHLNAFYAEYDNRFQYKRLVREDQEEVCSYLRGWKKNKEEVTDALDEELIAICRIFSHLDNLDIRCGAIYVDGRLEALSIGSLINNGKEAVIHVEKANDNIRGLYPLINKLFLLNEFPNVEIVNREEDLGIEGLRKAKLSYNPIQLLEKFIIREKNGDVDDI